MDATAPRADLHSHSTCSDGALSPEELVRAALEHCISMLALTDHDTTAGVAAAQAEGERLGLHVVAGVEITCELLGQEVHLLGLGIDTGSPELQALCRDILERRRGRFEEMHRRLFHAGVSFQLPEIPENASTGRPQMARALVEAGHAPSEQEAFVRYLRPGRAGYVEHSRRLLGDAVEAIHAAGGLAVLAHPGLYKRGDRLIFEARQLGVDGVECVHSEHSRDQTEHFSGLARKLEMHITGGADFHGMHHRRAVCFGNRFCPPEELERLASVNALFAGR